MPRRVPIRLVRLLAVACACVLPVASAHAAAPGNDVPTTPQVIDTLGWTSLSSPQDFQVTAAEWGEATTGPEDADPLPSCTGSTGFRSMWYSIAVPEAAVLRVTVVSTDPVRYQPVVSVLDPERQEVGCGLANDVRQGATANATAYVIPSADGTPATYLVRVAEVANNSPSGGLPTLTVRFAARDVTPPHIRVSIPSTTVAPGQPAVYDAGQTSTSALGTTDTASQVNPATARWEFNDKLPDKRDVQRVRSGIRVRYEWLSSGPHTVVFSVSDFAGNQSMYRFTTYVQDVTRPDVQFSLRPPAPGDRRLSITVHASESVRIRLLVTQAGRKGALLRRYVSFWGTARHTRSVPLRGIVGKRLVVVSGVARDLAGNASALPQCVIDPVTGQGSCFSP